MDIKFSENVQPTRLWMAVVSRTILDNRSPRYRTDSRRRGVYLTSQVDSKMRYTNRDRMRTQATSYSALRRDSETKL